MERLRGAWSSLRRIDLEADDREQGNKDTSLQQVVEDDDKEPQQNGETTVMKPQHEDEDGNDNDEKVTISSPQHEKEDAEEKQQESSNWKGAIVKLGTSVHGLGTSIRTKLLQRQNTQTMIQEDKELQELQVAIDKARQDLTRARAMASSIRRRQRQEISELRDEYRIRQRDLKLLTPLAQKYLSFFDYATVIREQFDVMNLRYTYMGWCEAWLLRAIHHSAMHQHQLGLIQRDSNTMLMDLYDSIPQIKHEESLVKAVAMDNFCKSKDSQGLYKMKYQNYVGIQQKMIYKLQRCKQELASEERKRRFSLGYGNRAEPLSFEEVAAMVQDKDDVIQKLNRSKSSTQTHGKGRKSRNRRLSGLLGDAQHNKSSSSLGDDSVMASSAKLGIMADDSDNDELRAGSGHSQKRKKGKKQKALSAAAASPQDSMTKKERRWSETMASDSGLQAPRRQREQV